MLLLLQINLFKKVLSILKPFTCNVTKQGIKGTTKKNIETTFRNILLIQDDKRTTRYINYFVHKNKLLKKISPIDTTNAC